MTPKGLALIALGLFALDVVITAGGNNGGAVGLAAIALALSAGVWKLTRLLRRRPGSAENE